MEMKPIGTVHTPFTDPAGIPIQPTGACGVKGTVEVLEEYRAGKSVTEKKADDRFKM